MGKKFIPNGDLDFVTKAEQIARAVAAEPGRFEISQADSDALSAAVKEFRAVLQACNREVRSRAMTRRKEQARSERA